jgi:hypothetical protein
MDAYADAVVDVLGGYVNAEQWKWLTIAHDLMRGAIVTSTLQQAGVRFGLAGSLVDLHADKATRE